MPLQHEIALTRFRVAAVQTQGHPELRAHLREPWRHNAHQRSRRAIQHESTAKDRSVLIKALAPHLVTHDENRRRARLAVVLCYATSRVRRHSQNLEKVR